MRISSLGFAARRVHRQQRSLVDATNVVSDNTICRQALPIGVVNQDGRLPRVKFFFVMLR